MKSHKTLLTQQKRLLSERETLDAVRSSFLPHYVYLFIMVGYAYVLLCGSPLPLTFDIAIDYSDRTQYVMYISLLLFEVKSIDYWNT